MSLHPAAISRKPPSVVWSSRLNAQPAGMWVHTSLACKLVVLCASMGAPQGAHLSTFTCAHTGVQKHRTISALCASPCAALGSVHNCPPVWACPAALQSQPAHLCVRTCCIPGCIPVPVCAAPAADPHRRLRAVAPAGCKYCQCGGEVERFMAQGQAHES